MLSLFIALLFPAEPPPQPRCAHDREAMLAMDWFSFDQGPDGWRSVSNREGCYEAAADLVQIYRSTLGLSDNTTLYVHEAQLRASVGETSRAIDLFEMARHDEDPFGWNIYMDASVAFLRGNREALRDARARLAALPIRRNFSTKTEILPRMRRAGQ